MSRKVFSPFPRLKRLFVAERCFDNKDITTHWVRAALFLLRNVNNILKMMILTYKRGYKKSRSSAFSHNNQTDECLLHQVISQWSKSNHPNINFILDSEFKRKSSRIAQHLSFPQSLYTINKMLNKIHSPTDLCPQAGSADCITDADCPALNPRSPALCFWMECQYCDNFYLKVS